MSACRGQAAASGGLPGPRLLGLRPPAGLTTELGHSGSRGRRSGRPDRTRRGTRTARERDVAPGPAAQHPPRADLGWADRVGDAFGTVWPHAIGAPLPNITQHVVEPPCIGLLEPHRPGPRPLMRGIASPAARAVHATL